mgnify:CR=1 FL=1
MNPFSCLNLPESIAERKIKYRIFPKNYDVKIIF